MGEPHGGIGGVDVLPACARSTIDIDLEVIVIDLDIDLLGHGQHRDGGGAGVDAPAAFGNRHALDAVDAALELQLGEHTIARKRGDHFLEPAQIVGIDRIDLHPPALRRRIAFVHAEQIGGEQRRFIAAGASADFEHGGAGIGAITGEHGDGERVFGLGEFCLEAGNFLLSHSPHFGIGFVDRGEAGEFAAHRRDLGGGARDGFQFRIIARGGDEVRTLQRPRSKPRFELGEAGRDLEKPGVGN